MQKATAPAPTTAQSLGSLLKSARDIMRKDKGLNGDLDRLPLLTWIMFLKFLDDLEIQGEEEAKLAGKKFRPAIEPPYRWRDWAANPQGVTGDELIAFINNDECIRADGKKGAGLFRTLRTLTSSNGDDRRDVIATVFKGVDNRMKSGYLLRDVVNKIGAIHFTSNEELHTLGALYESMLREMRDAAGEVTWEKPFLVKAGDILVSNIKAWEGALAVAKQEDDGRFGSHCYLTCVPIDGVATARFVCFYLLSPEGLFEVGEASPGSADRNRTLGAKALMQISIPLPEFSKQLWFDSLCGEVDVLKRLQAETAAELDALLPSILERAFKGELFESGRTVVGTARVTHKTSVVQLRQAVMNRAVKKLHCSNHFGRTEYTKIAPLVHCWAGIDLEPIIRRLPAGPADLSITDSTIEHARNHGLFKEEPRTGLENMRRYVPGALLDDAVKAEADLFEPEALGKLDKILKCMKEWTTKQAEAAASAFISWNDFLIDGKTPTDDEIIRDVQTNWHPGKNLSRNDLFDALLSLKRLGLKPEGRGPRSIRANAKCDAKGQGKLFE